MTSIVLWILGLILVYLEFYVPGAVLGTAGGLLLLASVFIFFMEYNSPILSILYFIAVAVSVGLVIKYALWKIPRIKGKRSIYSDAAQNGFQASGFDRAAIGKAGVVVSDLKPGGYILIAGKQHQAISESGYIPKGEEVVVLRGEGESLIVRKKTDS